MNSSQKDIRWKQRFHNFLSALEQLKSGVTLAQTRPLSELEKQGLIQSFEFTHELSWNVLKDFLEFQGNAPLMGSRDTTREAFQKGLIIDGEAWMEMIKSRNQTTHTYNKTVANEITDKIQKVYVDLFMHFADKMAELEKK